MKKIFLVALLSSIVLFSFSQDRSIGTYTFNTDNQYLMYTGTSLDVLSSTKDSIDIKFTMNKTYPTRYDIKVKVDTVHSGATASGRVSVILQGRKFTTDTWTNITSVSYYGTADTSIYYSLNTEEASTSTYTFLYDTTKVMNHATPVLKSLYSASGSVTTTGTVVRKYWYQYRILFIRSAGSSKIEYLETRFIQ